MIREGTLNNLAPLVDLAAVGALVAVAHWLGFGAVRPCTLPDVQKQLAEEFPGEHFTQVSIAGNGLAALALGGGIPVLVTSLGARLAARRLDAVAHWQMGAGRCVLDFADFAEPRLDLSLPVGEEAVWRDALAAVQVVTR